MGDHADGFTADETMWLRQARATARTHWTVELCEFITGVGAMAMGSTTYEWDLDHEVAKRIGGSGHGRYDVLLGLDLTGGRGRPRRGNGRRAREARQPCTWRRWSCGELERLHARWGGLAVNSLMQAAGRGDRDDRAVTLAAVCGCCRGIEAVGRGRTAHPRRGLRRAPNSAHRVVRSEARGAWTHYEKSTRRPARPRRRRAR